MAQEPMDNRKRARQQAEDGAAIAAEPEPANDAAPEDVEDSEAKRAKIDDTVAAKDDSGAEDAVAKNTNAPGGGKEGKKRKVAMLLAYCGAGYQGMQRNPGAITIEGELEQALFRANAIAQCNFGDMRKVDWMRAARTDKGVSAIGQIVSARLVIDPPGLVERVNQHLPKDIRVFGYTRVTSNFNAKQMCDKRRYEYLVPVFAFDPHAHHDRETMNAWNERKENVRLQRIEKRKALEQKEADAKDVTHEALQAKKTSEEGEVQTVEEVTMKEVVETEVTEASQPKTSEEGEVQTVEEVTVVVKEVVETEVTEALQLKKTSEEGEVQTVEEVTMKEVVETEVTEASQPKTSEEGEVQTVEEVTVVVKEVVETDVTEALQPKKTSEEGEVQTVEEVTMKEVVETEVTEEASQPKKTSEEGEVQTVAEVIMKEVVETEVTEALQPKTSEEGEVQTVEEVTMKEVVKTEVTEALQPKTSEEGEVRTVEEVTMKEVVKTEVTEEASQPKTSEEGEVQTVEEVTVVVKEVVETDVTEALQPKKTSEEGEVQTVEEVTMKEVVENEVTEASQPKKTFEEGEVQTVAEVTMVEVTEEASQAKASEGEVQTVEEVKEVVETEVEETGEREPFVFDEAKLQRLNDVLSRYNGTHNFHNFTARIKPEDPSANRYILSFEAGKVIEVQGTQFVPCTVVGQSFMLHQIRKMIGTAIAIMRGCVPETIIDFALRRENDVNTPMAPELGLFLDECYYTAYNKRFGKSHAELTQTGYEEMIQKFKHEVIYPHIATREAKDGTMALWLHSLNDRHYPYFETHRAASKN